MKINTQYFSKQGLQAFREYCSRNWGVIPLFTSLGFGAAYCTWFTCWTCIRKQDLCVSRREESPYYERMDPTDIVRLTTFVKPANPLTSEQYKLRQELGPFSHLPESKDKQ